jgi:hypothetical protein
MCGALPAAFHQATFFQAAQELVNSAGARFHLSLGAVFNLVFDFQPIHGSTEQQAERPEGEHVSDHRKLTITTLWKIRLF